MPIHDWTRIDVCLFHNFHRGWTVDLKRALNRELPHPDYFAVLERTGRSEAELFETDAANYARRTDRIVIRHRDGRPRAVIEVVSPGNKDSRHAIRSFTAKAADFLHNGINFVMIDPFPPGPRDPNGLHPLICDEFVGLPAEARPADKPLTVAAYDAGELTAYVEPLAVGDPLPDVPLFLAPGWYVNIPLERTYTASWAETPRDTRDLVEPPA